MLHILKPLLFAVCLGVIISNAEAEPQKFTPEQLRTYQAIKKRYLTDSHVTWHKGNRTTFEETLLDLDPILVGKNVVFNKKWMKLIGEGKRFTTQQFQVFKDNADIVYNCYLDLLGMPPKNKIILVDLQPAEHLTEEKNGKEVGHAGHSHRFTSEICLRDTDWSNSQNGRIFAQQGVFNITLMHEMGHAFTDRYYRTWEAEGEAAANLCVCYAVETIPGIKVAGIKFDSVGVRARYRKYLIEWRHKKFVSGDLETFAYGADAFDYYLWGLVDKVGWDTYKKVFRSYNDDSYKPTVKFTADPSLDYITQSTTDRMRTARAEKIANVRDFFARIEYFSGKPGVLRTLPDKGKILDQHFATTAAPLDDAGNETVAPSVVAVSLPKPVKPVPKPVVSVPKSVVPKIKPPVIISKPVQKPAPPAVPPEEEIKTLQAEIKTLQEQLDALPKTQASEPEMIRLYNDIAPLQNRLNVLMKK